MNQVTKHHEANIKEADSAENTYSQICQQKITSKQCKMLAHTVTIIKSHPLRGRQIKRAYLDQHEEH